MSLITTFDFPKNSSNYIGPQRTESIHTQKSPICLSSANNNSKLVDFRLENSAAIELFTQFIYPLNSTMTTFHSRDRKFTALQMRWAAIAGEAKRESTLGCIVGHE